MNISSKILVFILILAVGYIAIYPTQNKKEKEVINSDNPLVTPVAHASAVIKWDDIVVYADPAEEASSYNKFEKPDVVFITHIHADHLNNETLKEVVKEDTVILAPQSVIDELDSELVSKTQLLAAGTSVMVDGLNFRAIAAYNDSDEALHYHPKERGDIGVVLEKDGYVLYFSGDTEGVKEMLTIGKIDHAFVAMNLPYTMDEDQAAKVVAELSPRVVTPYHYRTPEGFSDLDEFERVLAKFNKYVKVERMEWYK